ncbi:thioredoxin-disulfide reductase [Chryseolinea sp. T2]|uniref:thioredoxin-disulfide reductase n=1 Tax=Chryseolinea sp. T2 TaxID=3129255 RepID=UPI003076F013
MKTNTLDPIQCLIIGSGPAGYTAAIYAARAGLSPVLYQGIQPGGQLITTTEVENYPGFADGVQGPDMMMHFEKQALRMGADIRYGIVTQVDFTGPLHRVQLNDEDWLSARTVIICTGASAKWLGLESEKRLNGYGVSACAVCDGFFFRGKDVAIVGAGDTACEEALYLSKLCRVVHMIVRKDAQSMKASKVMQQRVNNTANIRIHWNSETLEILGDKEVEAIVVRNNATGEQTNISADAFFVAIGHKPNSDIFRGWLDMDVDGYLLTQPDSTATNISGVFAAGDIQDRTFRQAITAAGTGCMAALEAERYLTALVHGQNISSVPEYLLR